MAGVEHYSRLAANTPAIPSRIRAEIRPENVIVHTIEPNRVGVVGKLLIAPSRPDRQRLSEWDVVLDRTG